MHMDKKTEIENSEDVKRDNYNNVVSSFELSSIRLVDISFAVKEDYEPGFEGNKLSYGIEMNEHIYDTESGIAAAFVLCNLNSKTGRKNRLSCSAKYVVAYSANRECDPMAVEAYLRRVAVFACYPYFRGIVANLDWAASTRLPPLPVHRENIKN
jgi:hypothetical protein